MSGKKQDKKRKKKHNIAEIWVLKITLFTFIGYLQLYFADNDVKKRYNNINNAVVIYDIDKYYL